MKTRFQKFILSLTLLVTLGSLFGWREALAQTDAQLGLDTVATASGLPQQNDPTVIVARIIRDFLAVLGIIAIVIIMYAGFLWMTAGGDGKRVDRAKRMLINATIGLLIILAAVGITQFILSALINATTGTGGGTNTNPPGGGLGGGSSTVFSITKQQPTGESNIRNLVPQITFSNNLDPATVTPDSITFKYTDGDIVIPGTLVVSGNRVSFTPSTPCPTPNEDRGCFDEDVFVDVYVTTAVKNTVGTSLSCTNNLCRSLFKSGSLIDTDNPTAELTLPDDGAGVPSDSLVDVQVHAFDDAQVAVADFAASDVQFDSVPATGPSLTDVLIDTKWDTASLLNGSSYRLTTTVIDMAGNTDTDSITVKMRPPTCFNSVIDGIETGLNCGGDSSSAEYCGACAGSSCSTSADCSTGLCLQGVCVEMPVVETVSPPDGAPGTWVTIAGQHFGNFTGQVTFTSAAGPVVATLASCSDAWMNSQIIAVVPATAVDGPISVTTSAGLTDETFDDQGGLIADFDVNTVLHPGLCHVSPSSAAATDAVELTGVSLGTTRDTSTVNFDATEAGSYTAWSDTSATVTVPGLADDDYAVTATVGGVPSNAIAFTVSANATATPEIVSVSPNSGGVGQYVTLDGTNFGGGTGVVWFENAVSGERTQAINDFPAACANNFWSDRQILTIVPEALRSTLGEYAIFVVSSSGVESNTQPFTVTAAAPTPGLCKIDPNKSLSGDSVTLLGSNFGTSSGQVQFTSGKDATTGTWANGEIAATVPLGAISGPVTVKNSVGDLSNPVNFEVGPRDGAAAVSRQAGYAWSFSSGSIPDAPRALFECSETQVSGVPNDTFTDGTAVCANVSVFLEFDLPMNEATLTGVSLSECTANSPNPCGSTVPVTGTYVTTSRSVTFDPTVNLKPGTTYQATTTENMLSAEGEPLGNPGSWTFTTRQDATPCVLQKVLVSPNEAIIRELRGTQDFTASPINGCMVLKNVDYKWSWSVDPSYARFDTTSDADCTAGDSTCALVQALAEGVTPVTAEEVKSRLTSEATLTIDFTDPYVTNHWPNCTEACVNAEVGGSFNTAMLRASVERAGRVALYRCANELCSSLQLVTTAAAHCVLDANNACNGFAFSHLTLTPQTYYRVIVSGDVTSTSGVALTRTNYGGDYSWIFRVREDASLCAVDRISVSPSAVLAKRVLEQQTFNGEAFGEADSCSVSGQRLSGFAYNWNWTDPIDDADVDNNPATRVAAWADGQLTDSNPSGLPNGCTASCVAAGSVPLTAICGDGRVDVGEECEDGNVAPGDGCSANCLREGGVAPTCGNGRVDRRANQSGEDCDDGNLVDGDGCSASCLAEGASAVGATCGNTDVAQVTGTLAGEECDDGNATRGDGCSNECLWEGSPTLVEIGGAVCGDGGDPETPAEQCDDGNVRNGDGCSSSCLWEGSGAAYLNPSVCGTGGVEYGEACDDGNALSGDGCSSACLLEGSSTVYSNPSFCGDGVLGVGELAMCETGVSGDGKIDPIQVAAITNDAVREVDPVSHEAVATIEVSEVSSGLSTTAEFALSCAAESDLDCVQPDLFGAGENGCCMERPTVTLFPNGNGLCRNSAMYAIFSEEMDIQDFTYEASENGTTVTKYRMYAKLDTSSTGGVCPADHTTLAVEPRNLVLRVWNSLVRVVTGRSAKATAGDCIAPLESFEQIKESDGTFRVYLHSSALLAAKGAYTLVVEGDEAPQDDVAGGVKTVYGVGLAGNQGQLFTVGTEVCALDTVEVFDTNTTSPYVFTTGGEEHLFTANAISHVNGIPQAIDSIAGVYSWSWGDWKAERESEVVTVAQVSTVLDTATVTAVGENGDDAVLVTATINDNSTNLPTAESITGSVPILAFLCENPWPSPYSMLPWSDTADGDIGAEIGAGWMNYSTMYCRDAGTEGLDGDLPDVTVVRPPVSESAGVIKEYLYEVSGGPDAIGVRVVSNPHYLSPRAWYAAQGFTGEVTDTDIDGFKAVKDGRTTYVVAPNQAPDGTLYSNVYVISYNEGASSETINLYDQMLNNFRFAINLDNVSVCETDDAACSSARLRLRRDTARLTDMTDIQTELSTYQRLNGSLPTLPAGTFVRALSSSAWESWGTMLGGALGDNALAADPLNNYAACGVTGSGFEAYSPLTCVDPLLGSYVCPTGSHAYHYRSIGDNEARLYADLEYTSGVWANDIEDDTDAVAITVGGASISGGGFTTTVFCDGGNVYGTSTTCGDGVVGGAEVCELGQAGGIAVACTTSASLAGTRSQTCNASCGGYVDDATAICVVASCGNGVVEFANGEDCDDGSKNGDYGFCGNDCTRDTAFFCGDGKLAGGEACDCGATTANRSLASRAFEALPGSCGVQINGTYAPSPNSSCAWDCAGPAAYCGDGTIDSGEVCDGTDATWDGKLCANGSPSGLENQPCTVDADCGGGVCGGSGTGNRTACQVGFTRVKICDDNPGSTCQYAVNDWYSIPCTEIGACGDGTVDPGEECDDGNVDGSDSCTDQCKTNVCGDGYVLVGAEQCDEGAKNGQGCDSAYDSSCTACSLSCRYAVSSGEFCGDGEKNGDEFCDANDLPYTFYAASSNTTFGTCTTLGNTTQNGGTTYTCSKLGICNGGTDNGDACLSNSECSSSKCVFPTCANSCLSSCPFVYSSIAMQMETNQPGSDPESSVDLNSYNASSTSDLPNAATINVPACEAATKLTANVSLANVTPPTTYIMFVTDLSYTMNYLVGSDILPSEAVPPGGNSRLAVAQGAIRDAVEDLFNALGSHAKIGAIGYKGLVRGQCFNNSQDGCLVNGVPVDSECDAGGECNVANSDLSANPQVNFGYQFDFVGPSSEAELVTEISSYIADQRSAGSVGHGTFTSEALEQTKRLFDQIRSSPEGDNARFITILLSDGEVTNNSHYAVGNGVSPDPVMLAQDFDSYIRGAAGYELYTATIGKKRSWLANMKQWSSNTYDGETHVCTVSAQCTPAAPETSAFNGLDYAYNGNNPGQMRDMYTAITNSITSVTATVIASHGNQVTKTTGDIEAGTDVELPWPENFVCDGVHEQQVPLQIMFPGSGMIKVSNVRLNYCAP